MGSLPAPGPRLGEGDGYESHEAQERVAAEPDERTDRLSATRGGTSLPVL